MFFITWIVKSNPKLRVDQVTDLAWKVLGPVALISLIGGAFWVGGQALL